MVERIRLVMYRDSLFSVEVVAGGVDREFQGRDAVAVLRSLPSAEADTLLAFCDAVSRVLGGHPTGEAALRALTK